LPRQEGEGGRAQDLWARIYLWTGLLGFFALVIYVMIQRTGPLYDEPLHLARALAFNARPSFSSWLINNTSSAPGPVFSLMHYALSLGHGALPVPWVRLPNLLLLGAILWLAARHLEQLGHPHARAVGVSSMGVPMVWVLAGLALTEVPSMAGVALALVAAFEVGRSDPASRVWRQVILGLIVALGVAIAVGGRQTYLAIVPSIFLLAASRRATAMQAAIAIGLGLVPAALLFLTWRGLVPPGVKAIVRLERGYRSEFVVLAFGYAGITALLLAPRLFLLHPKKVAVAVLGAVLVNSLLLRAEMMPLQSVVHRVHSPLFARVLTWASGQIFAVVGGAFLASVVLEMSDRRTDRIFVAHALGLVLLCFECGAMPFGFSSRYIGMGLPLLVPLMSRYLVFGPWAVARLCLGMALGFASLHSYFHLVSTS